MDNIKLNYALIFAMILQAIGLIWYVSKLDSKVETVYKFYEQESQKSVVVTQVKMQFDLERVMKDIEEIKKESRKVGTSEYSCRNIGLILDEAKRKIILAYR